MTTTLFPVIMAGGSGTRFWPLSRKSRPKQFLPLTTELPLIAETARRLNGLARPQDTLVVCGKIHVPLVRKALKLPPKNIIVEPQARNTAPAIALAAAHVAARDPRGILIVLPSDHHVANLAGFRELLERAAKVAETGALVTIGLQPTRPETGYGYIRVGEPLEGVEGARKVAAFVEKPDLTTARGYLASGDYLWNGGIFLFRADAILAAFQQHMPDLFSALKPIQAAIGKKTYPSLLAKNFARMPATSIDYGIMEKAKNIAVVPGDFGWSDVGSFAALPEVRSADDRGNVVSGKAALVVECENCVVIAGNRPVAAVGLSNVVVVDAGDAILVVPKDKSQDVRKAVEALKARKLEKFL